MGELKIKRIYLPPEVSDGRRILVDRLWPRGVSKEKAELDGWAKDAAPSPELRTWFGHDPARFEEFAFQYQRELDGNPAAAELAVQCRTWLEAGNVTLLYAARSETCNHALILRDWVNDRLL